MNYMDIVMGDVANGPGVRLTLFVSGCPHHCPGCFNPESWDFNAGKPFTEEEIEKCAAFLRKYRGFVTGISILGGEPFAQDCRILCDFIDKMKEIDSSLSVWIWSGYTLEEILQDENKIVLLNKIDILIDGRFIEAEKDLTLPYRGSRNQKIHRLT